MEGRRGRLFMSTLCALLTTWEWGMRRLGRLYLLAQPLPLHSRLPLFPNS